MSSTDETAAGSERAPAWPAVGLTAALALAALAWAPFMRHPTYARAVLLAVLAAPAAAAGFLALGPTRAALAGWPARLFLVAVWGQAALAWASLAWTSNSDATLARAVELSALALWGTGWLLAAAGPLRGRLLAGHFGVGTLIALVGCGCYLVMLLRGTAPPRLGSPIGNPNTVAVLMIFPVMGAAALLLSAAGILKAAPGEKKVSGTFCAKHPKGRSGKRFLTPFSPAWASGPWPRLILPLLVGGLGLAAFWLAGSRSGQAGLAAAALVLAGLHLRPKGRLALAVLAFVVLAGGALWLTGESARLARVEERVKLTSIGARYYGTIASWGILREHPLGGAGAGTFLSEAPAHIPPERYLGTYAGSFLNLAHNEYAQTAAELGLAGLGLLVLLFVSGVWGGVRGALGEKKVSGTFCRNGPSGALHKRFLTPFPPARALGAGLAAALAGVAASSLADPSLRFWDFTGFCYAAAGLAAAGPGVAGLPEIKPGATERRVPRRLRAAVGLGALAVAALTAVFWAAPDGRRECRLLLANDLAAVRHDYPEAARQYQIAALTRGNFLYRVQARFDWIRALELAGEGAKALAEAERLAGIVPDCPPVLRQLAAMRAASGDRAGALWALVAAGRRDPYDDSARSNLVRVLAAEPEAGRAALIDSAAAQGELSRGDRAMLRSLAAAAGRDLPGALAALDGLAPGEVSFLPLEFWRGLCLFEVGRPGDAAVALDRHLRIEPLHAEGWYWRARALDAARGAAAWEEVSAALGRCFQLDEGHDQARLELARRLLDRKEYDAARAVLQRRLVTTARLTEFALLLAETHYQQGRLDQARRVLERAWRMSGDRKLQEALGKLEALERKPGVP